MTFTPFVMRKSRRIKAFRGLCQAVRIIGGYYRDAEKSKFLRINQLQEHNWRHKY